MDTDEQTKRSSWRRFSLREILLAMTAVAALLSHYSGVVVAKTSAFARDFDVREVLTGVLEQEGLTGTITGKFNGYGGGDAVDWSFRFKLSSIDPEAVTSKVMPAFYGHLLRAIPEGGCRITGKSSKGIPAADRGGYRSLSSFSIEYQGKSTRGVCRAFVTHRQDGRPIILVILSEW